MKLISIFSLAYFAIQLFTPNAKAAQLKIDVTTKSDPQLNYELSTFRLNTLYGTYFSGEVFSGSLSWVPSVQFNNQWGNSLLIGVSLLKDANRGNSRLFLAPEIQLLTSYRFYSQFSVEAGGGLQKWWVLDGTTNPILTANLHYQFKKSLGPIERVFVGYSAIWEIVTHNQIRIGVQLRF